MNRARRRWKRSVVRGEQGKLTDGFAAADFAEYFAFAVGFRKRQQSARQHEIDVVTVLALTGGASLILDRTPMQVAFLLRSAMHCSALGVILQLPGSRPHRRSTDTRSGAL